MTQPPLPDLSIFLTIAREGSFTRAAARLGVSQSALSHSLRALESRLGLRLLARTTRSVSPTEAGQRLLATLGPALDDIATTLSDLSALRDRPSGNIRLTAGDHSAETILAPRLPAFLRANPEVTVEVNVDYALTDIVAERFDAGIRLGEQVASGMIATRVGPDFAMIVVASPDHLAAHGTPQMPQDLTRHACINLRLATKGDLYAWEFAKAGHSLRVRVDGPLIFNRTPPMIACARAGLGFAYVPQDRVAPDLASGALVQVLADWCPNLPGYHLYYPSRRSPSAAFTALVNCLRWR